MTDDTERFFVLTGGPGSGKTTLIEALRRAGHACSMEAGRAIIQDEIAGGGRALPWIDPAAFAEKMLAFEMQSHAAALRESGVVFFDRGVPDVAGYLRLSGLPVPAHVDEAARTLRYNTTVFIAPPWEDIFGQDSERKQDFAEAMRTYDAMVKTYAAYGYELMEIPRASVETRVEFMLDAVERLRAPRRPDAGP